MSTLDRVSVRSVRLSHQQHEKAAQDKNEVFGFYVFRPLSFYPTAWLLNLGLSANQTTWLSIAVLVTGCILLATGNYSAAIIGALLVNIWIILDFVDGNIARYCNTFSAYGDFLDFLGASIAHLVFFAMGIGVYNNQDQLGVLQSANALSNFEVVTPIILGAWASLAAIWIRVVYQKFKSTFQASDFQRYDVVGMEGSSSFLRTALKLANNIFDLSGFLLPILLLSVIFRIVDLFLLFVAVANTMALIISLVQIVRRASATEDVNSPA